MPLDLAAAGGGGLADSFVLFSNRSASGSSDAPNIFTAQLVALPAITVRIRQSSAVGTCVVAANFDVQVVSLTGATVTRGVLAPAAGAIGPFTVSQTTAPGAPTFLLYSLRMTGDVGANNICRRRLRGEITATQLSFTRGCETADIQDIVWEYVTLPGGSSVQQMQGTLADGAPGVGVTTSTVTFTNAVDLTRSVGFMGGLGPSGSASGSTNNTNDRLGSALSRATMTSSTQLTFNRTSPDGAGAWTAFVVEWVP